MTTTKRQDGLLKVTRKDSQRLVMKTQLVLLLRILGFLLFSGGILLGLSTVMSLNLGKTELTCDRPNLETTRCQKTQSIGSFPIYQHSVEIQSMSVSGVDITVLTAWDSLYKTRIWLSGRHSSKTTWLGVESMQTLSSDGSSLEMQIGFWKDFYEAEAIANEIQRFLGNPAQPSLRVISPSISWIQAYNQRLSGIAFALQPAFIVPFSIIGLVFMSFRQGYYKFDRLTGQLSYQSIFAWQKEKTLPLAEIKSVAIEEFTAPSADDTSSTYSNRCDIDWYYRIVILTKTGERLPIESSAGLNLEKTQETAEAIREFLALPPVQIVPGKRLKPFWAKRA
ncbi:hypothetical protein [Thermoleptolyngbya sp. C42_A2020_037]|uniref:hypothetical protein n=1 Tax=Thermoleptolyngbya sp. C42_A2020_037 TaxID=2747799 RepID=UPI0019DF8A80|nr:hypothetical protein [Thermoleptolyngbya sp. C42_A2020_037]MBF2084602.1 hypothetical protein [Thermoleptolyngbya sp. C42_A2020_037]